MGPPRPHHKVRLLFSSPLVRSKVEFTRSEALSRAIFVFKIFEFLCEASFVFARSLPANTSARETPLGQSLWPKLRVQEHDLPLGAPFLCQGNRHTKKLAHKVFRALVSWRNRASPRKSGGKNFRCPFGSFVFFHKNRHTKNRHTKFFVGPLVVKKLAVKDFVCLSWLRKRQEKTPNSRLSYLGRAAQAPI